MACKCAFLKILKSYKHLDLFDGCLIYFGGNVIKLGIQHDLLFWSLSFGMLHCNSWLCLFNKYSKDVILLCRPSFKFFTWYTAFFGLVGTLIMMFIINPLYAFSSILLCVLLILLLHLFSPSRSADWGSISQALIFHQVSEPVQSYSNLGLLWNKYLVKLGIRTVEHLKKYFARSGWVLTFLVMKKPEAQGK